MLILKHLYFGVRDCKLFEPSFCRLSHPAGRLVPLLLVTRRASDTVIISHHEYVSAMQIFDVTYHCSCLYIKYFSLKWERNCHKISSFFTFHPVLKYFPSKNLAVCTLPYSIRAYLCAIMVACLFVARSTPVSKYGVLRIPCVSAEKDFNCEWIWVREGGMNGALGNPLTSHIFTGAYRIFSMPWFGIPKRRFNGPKTFARRSRRDRYSIIRVRCRRLGFALVFVGPPIIEY